ncbi:MAG: PAS-domain containing protein [Hylemonella sp.]|uniref:PAS-domain containing protein n=1 Tax=Hylemonella sp. TaxID=2066020 RepID=UPI0022C731E2|nr:PAS-domain containing protein [Hylemonella sp.]MCZ8251420.1 PAS-domain containing protein [Hylemonella sp.]
MSHGLSKIRPQLLLEVVLIVCVTQALVAYGTLQIPLALDILSKAMLHLAGLGLLAAPLLVWRWRVHVRTTDVPQIADSLRHSAAFRRAWLSSVAIFTAGALLSLGLARSIWADAYQEGEERYQRRVKQAESNLRIAFEKAESGLQGLIGIHAADGQFDRELFRKFWEARGYTRDFPGIRGFGYIERVPRDALGSYLRQQRRTNLPDFQLKTSGNAPDLFVITLLEPVQSNAAAIGLDIGSEPVRRAAAEKAIRTGKATLTGAITLLQDNLRRPGFLLLAPLYAGGRIPDSVEERIALHVGFAYAPIIAQDAMSVFESLSARDLTLQVHALGVAGDKTLVYQTTATPTDPSDKRPNAGGGRHRAEVSFTIANQPFTLSSRSTAAFDATTDENHALLVASTGLLISALIALTYCLLGTARLRAEQLAQDLTVELQRLSSIAQRTRDAVIITDESGRITWTNEAFTRVSGYSADEARGLKPGALLQSDRTDPATVATLSQRLSRREACHVEIQNRHKDGSHYWLELEIQPITDALGQFSGYMAVERDITEQRAAQDRERQYTEQLAAALRETEALMSTINAHAIVSEAGRDGRITRANDAFCKISGYSREELLGQDHRIVNSGTHDRAFWVGMWRQISRGQAWRGQICNRAKDGSLYWVDSIVAPFTNANGEIERYVSIRFDITAARAAEMALARERQRLENTLEGTRVGTWEVNLRTGESRIDERWASMLGYTLEELTPMTYERWKALIHPEDEKRSASHLKEYLLGRQDYYEMEWRLRHKSGEWLWILSRGTASKRLVDGQVEWMAGTHMDVSERHQLQDEVSRRNQLMSVIIENLPGGLSAFDADLNLILKNSKFGGLLELPDTLLEASPATFESIIRHNAGRGEYGPGDPDRIVAAIVERARHPVPHVMERTRPDGTVLEVRGLPLPGGGFVTTYTDVTERKRLEQALRKSEEMLERAGQVAGIGGWSLDLATNEVYWSQQTRRIHEVPDGYVPSLEHALSFYTPDSAAAMKRAVERAIQEGAGFDVETELTTATGRKIWVRSVGEAEFVNGKAVRLIGAFQDITTRRNLERRVREQNQLLTAVLENMPGGLAAFDRDLMLIMRNRQFGTLLDFPESIFEREPVRYQDLVRNEAERGEFGAGDVEDIVARAVKSLERPRERIFERVRPNGQTLEVRAQPMSGGGVLYMMIDVTARKLAEREAHHADEMLRQAINTLDEAFVIYDDQDRLLICNQRYRDTYPIAAVVMKPGATFEEIIRYGAERGEYTAAIGRVDEWVAERLAQHRQANTDLVQALGDGRYLRIVERKTSDGYIVGFRIDITDLVRSRNEAEQANRAKSQFLANMSHEIRTPMNAILGMLSLLQRSTLTPRQQDYVSKTEGAARSLLGLLNDILDFSKVEAGKMALEAAPFQVETLMRDLAVILSANTGDKTIEVLFQIDPQVPATLVGDSLRLKQVLINLGGNAIKFTEHGTVFVQIAVTDRQPGRVTLDISVQDTGIGIAPEHLERIFEGFSQAEASTTRRFGGTGLGLAISARLVQLMGGQLQVESTPGIGSLFHFQIQLPIAGADALPLIAPPAQTALRQLEVLFIDDNDTARVALRAMALPMGWQVDLAASGKEALAMIDARRARGAPPYDAVFVDWQMPGMDGWETSLAIRQRAGPGRSPLLMMVTAHGRETLARRPSEEQALLDGFVVKPVTPSMLLDAVQDARRGPVGAAAETLPRGLAGRLTGMRILVVEDNKVNQQVAQELLEREGALIGLADNGALGVQAIAQADPPWDAVLMDVQMPVMDGYTATRQVRETLKLLKLPIIAMTANAMDSDRQDAYAAGMNAHIGKPFSLDALVTLLVEHTGHRPPKAATPARAAPKGAADSLPLQNGPSGQHAIDIDGTLLRLGGDQTLLRIVLETFVRDLPAQGSRLHKYLQAAEIPEARRQMHSLKGSAATVGAKALSDLAAELERRIDAAQGVAADEAAEIVARLSDACELVTMDVHRVLALLRHPTRPQTSAPPALDASALTDELRELQALLRRSDMDSLEVHARLQERHPGLPDELRNPLSEAIAELDFQRAAELCDELINRYTE